MSLALFARVPYKVKKGDLKDKTPVFELEVSSLSTTRGSFPSCTWRPTFQNDAVYRSVDIRLPILGFSRVVSFLVRLALDRYLQNSDPEAYY